MKSLADPEMTRETSEELSRLFRLSRTFRIMLRKGRVIIVRDEPFIREFLTSVFSKVHVPLDVAGVASEAEAQEYLKEAGPQGVRLFILNAKTETATAFVQWLHESYPQVPLIVIAHSAQIATQVRGRYLNVDVFEMGAACGCAQVCDLVTALGG